MIYVTYDDLPMEVKLQFLTRVHEAEIERTRYLEQAKVNYTKAVRSAKSTRDADIAALEDIHRMTVSEIERDKEAALLALREAREAGDTE